MIEVVTSRNAHQYKDALQDMFHLRHRIFVDGRLAVEGSETRVWAAQDPSDSLKLRTKPIPAAVIERFRAA